jgi:hypothetical protein
MNDVRVFGHCECCNNKITDSDEGYYVNEDGKVFCSVECVCEYYGVVKMEV